MLSLANILLTIIHLAIILINTLGWIFSSTRRFHFIIMLLTWFSWIVPGFWLGFGYCFLTDIQWSVKAKLGETNLPPSFITYALEEFTGKDFSDSVVELATALVFVAVTIISIYFRFIHKK